VENNHKNKRKKMWGEESDKTKEKTNSAYKYGEGGGILTTCEITFNKRDSSFVK
jgi:hypothetical protein